MCYRQKKKRLIFQDKYIYKYTKIKETTQNELSLLQHMQQKLANLYLSLSSCAPEVFQNPQLKGLTDVCMVVNLISKCYVQQHNIPVQT
jgi:hypothetical protein